jgi:hypothetical protein
MPFLSNKEVRDTKPWSPQRIVSAFNERIREIRQVMNNNQHDSVEVTENLISGGGPLAIQRLWIPQYDFIVVGISVIGVAAGGTLELFEGDGGAISNSIGGPLPITTSIVNHVVTSGLIPAQSRFLTEILVNAVSSVCFTMKLRRVS